MLRFINIKHILIVLVIVLFIGICYSYSNKVNWKFFDVLKRTVIDEVIVRTDKSIYTKKDLSISITIENNLSQAITYSPDSRIGDGTEGVYFIVEKFIDNEWLHWDNTSSNRISLGKKLNPNDMIVYDFSIDAYLPRNFKKEGEYRICFPFDYQVDKENEGSNNKYHDGVSYAYFSIE